MFIDESPAQQAEGEGRETAVAFAAYLDDDTITHAHDPAILMEQLTPAQELLLPDSPYMDLGDDLHDQWTTGFWQALEEIGQIREDAARR